ncbi:uncharacterized protein LOC117136814 isoform X1 [Drosophila mauritiana]|uniref:Uncharacterized protein LOC117136814 isoform X1 n=1 Tax=Drosophila mauritiana TaxID=7226 RepID=A0A6P8JDS6_DROMA|nr:uncharacterized protein LOC117136814 isoform X1 [Drosophila mauritiana]XP_033153774.1 uncharacterized protein LOC117136814 isoform X1 [Drosophila mauritiana]
MCCNANRQILCVFIGVLAILIATLCLGFTFYRLCTTGISHWEEASLVAWVSIILAAIPLIIGAIKEIPYLLVIWIVVAIISGVSLLVIQIEIFNSFFNTDPDTAFHILGGMVIIVFVLLISCFIYFPYTYARELEGD